MTSTIGVRDDDEDRADDDDRHQHREDAVVDRVRDQPLDARNAEDGLDEDHVREHDRDVTADQRGRGGSATGSVTRRGDELRDQQRPQPLAARRRRAAHRQASLAPGGNGGRVELPRSACRKTRLRKSSNSTSTGRGSSKLSGVRTCGIRNLSELSVTATITTEHALRAT
jgi:hypothetical protein